MANELREPYDQVHALLLGWEHNDDDSYGNKKMRTGLKELDNVLKGHFAYQTYSSWRIPVEKATDHLFDCLRGFRDKHDGPRTLLIIYYAGHGAIDKTSLDLFWLLYERDDEDDTPLTNPGYPGCVQWNALQTAFLAEVHQSDVLLVMDCCNALGAFKYKRSNYPGTIMLWAACTREEKSPMEGQNSFTMNVVVELKKLKLGGENVDDIHTAVLDRMGYVQALSGLGYKSTPQCIPIHRLKMRPFIRLKRLVTPTAARFKGSASQTELATAQSNTQDVSSPLPSRGDHDEASQNASQAPAVPEQDASLADTSSPSAEVPSSETTEIDLPQPAQDSRTAKFKEMLYREIHDMYSREAAIVIASYGTFEWIFAHDAFVGWATGSVPLLWISGKPGSGKSTLMKMIQNQPKLKAQFMAWTGGAPISIASHYFWASGTPIMRSFEGLAANLLFQLIGQYPRAGDIAVQMFESDRGSNSNIGLSSWASRSFIQVLQHPTLSKTYWCFFIDGLDECDSSTESLEHALNFIESLASIRNVKVCVSSRPYSMIEYTMGGMRRYQIRLQDLTSQDIKAYVEYRLSKYVGKGRLTLEQGQKISYLVVHRAEGVFLWVMLAIRSLERGLRSGDAAKTLEKRLEQLPRDLEELYQQMLARSSLSPRSARVFLIVFACETDVIDVNSAVTVQPLLTTTILYYALHEDLEMTLKTPIRVLRAYDVRKMADEIAAILQADTQGLLAPEQSSYANSPGAQNGYPISYLHKTARDFLQDMNVRERFQKVSTNYNPNEALLGAFVMELKTLDFGVIDVVSLDNTSKLRCWSVIDQAVKCAHNLKQIDTCVILLDELDRVMSFQILKWSDGSFHDHWSSLLPLGNQRAIGGKDDFLSFAIRCGLYQYVKWKLGHRYCTTSKPGRPLLSYAIDSLSHTAIESAMERTIEVLLEYGADPNEVYCGETAWRQFLKIYHLHNADNVSSDDTTRLRIIHGLFLSHGADPGEVGAAGQDPQPE